MSFFPRDAPVGAEWGPPGRQPSWEQQVPPSRSGAASTAPEPNAFIAQLDEIDKAVDNLVKSGKFQPGLQQHFSAPYSATSSRRESGPVLGRQYSDYDPRSGGSSRNQSVTDFEGGRAGSSAGLQNYYAAQRFQPRQVGDQDQMAQAKRRLAAQRERELRNYHQEQQYNRKAPGAQSDRSQSPNGMNEDERRELIQRQHRALYGNDSSLYPSDGHASRPSQDARVPMSAHPRGSSPLAFDPFGVQGLGSGSESAVQLPTRDIGLGLDKKNSSSPTIGRSTFGMVDSVTQIGSNKAISPATSPPLSGGNLPSIASQSGVGAIGSRLAQIPAINTKRTETPNERSTSSASNPTSGAEKNPALSAWGSSSGVWGASKTPLGVQASVWG